MTPAPHRDSPVPPAARGRSTLSLTLARRRARQRNRASYVASLRAMVQAFVASCVDDGLLPEHILILLPERLSRAARQLHGGEDVAVRWAMEAYCRPR